MIPPKPWSHHFWATIKLSFPLMLGQIALISIWTADIVMMGWISTDSLAAGTQANRMYQPLYFIAIGLTLAVSPLTSQALGENGNGLPGKYCVWGFGWRQFMVC